MRLASSEPGPSLVTVPSTPSLPTPEVKSSTVDLGATTAAAAGAAETATGVATSLISLTGVPVRLPAALASATSATERVKLHSVGCWLGTQVVGTGLETLLPTVEVHRSELTESRCRQVDVERLRLADESTTVGRHVDDSLLTDLPNGLVELLDTVRDTGNVLNRTTVSDDTVLHGVVPKTLLNELTEQPRVDDLELTSEYTARVDVRGVRLEALVEAENLTGRGSRHGSEQERVAKTVLGNLGLEAGPVPEVGGCNTPHVVLELTLRSGGTGVGLVGAVLLGKLAGSLESSVVDGLEDLNVEAAGLGRLKSVAHDHEGVSKTLNTDTMGRWRMLDLRASGTG